MSVAITLPKWLTRTRTMQFNSVDVVLIMALTLRIHGTAKAIRKTAMNIRFKVCKENQPKMKQLARLDKDEEVILCAFNIVQLATDKLGIHPGKLFEFMPPTVLQDPPKCHYKAMRLAGDPGARHWQCQHCSHTKPLEIE